MSIQLGSAQQQLPNSQVGGLAQKTAQLDGLAQKTAQLDGVAQKTALFDGMAQKTAQLDGLAHNQQMKAGRIINVQQNVPAVTGSQPWTRQVSQHTERPQKEEAASPLRVQIPHDSAGGESSLESAPTSPQVDKGDGHGDGQGDGRHGDGRDADRQGDGRDAEEATSPLDAVAVQLRTCTLKQDRASRKSRQILLTREQSQKSAHKPLSSVGSGADAGTGAEGAEEGQDEMAENEGHEMRENDNEHEMRENGERQEGTAKNVEGQEGTADEVEGHESRTERELRREDGQKGRVGEREEVEESGEEGGEKEEELGEDAMPDRRHAIPSHNARHPMHPHPMHPEQASSPPPVTNGMLHSPATDKDFALLNRREEGKQGKLAQHEGMHLLVSHLWPLCQPRKDNIMP